MAQDVTKTQLNDMVKDILTAELGKSVADAVEASVAKSVEKALEPVRARQSTWEAQILGAQQTADKAKARGKGEAAGRIIRAFASSKAEGTGLAGIERTLTGWGDADLAKAVMASREKALSAGSGSAGGFIVPDEYSTDILDARRAMTVVRRLGPREFPMVNGTLHLPKVATGSSGGYIGENTNAPNTQPVFGENVLTAKKLAAIVPISNDLIRYSSPQADAVVRDDLVRGLAVNEDAAFLRGDGTGGSPRGIRNWAASGNVIAASTFSLANVAVDFGAAMLGLMNNNVPPGRWAWIFAPRTWKALTMLQTTTGDFAFRPEMSAGTLFGFPYAMTTAVPINLTVGSNADCSEVYLVNFDDMAIADSQRLIIDASTEAAYNNGSSVVAAFSLDQTVIRAIAEHDFAARDANAIAVLTNVRYGA